MLRPFVRFPQHATSPDHPADARKSAQTRQTQRGSPGIGVVALGGCLLHSPRRQSQKGDPRVSKTRFIADCLVALLVVGFVAKVWPATYSAADQSAVLFPHEFDAVATVMPPLLEIYSGEIPPKFAVYGHFPAYLTALVSLPVLGPIKLIHGAIDYTYFVRAMRWTQLGMAVITVVYVFRIGTLIMPPLAAVFPVILLLTMTEFYTWTLRLHPDIFQTAMLVVAVFYLMRGQQNGTWRDLCLSAVAAGLSTASKYYGVFIFPAVALALVSGKVIGFRRVPGAVREVLLRGTVYGLIVVALFSVINVRLFFSAAELRDHVALMEQLTAEPGQRFLLFASKVGILVSPNLLGAAVPILYVAAWAWICAGDGRQWIKGNLVFHPSQVIHATCWSFFLYFLLLFADVFNLYQGDRYALPFLCLAPIPVVHLLSSMLTVPGRSPGVVFPWTVRAAAVVLIALTGFLQVRRVAGEPLDLYRPTPRLLQVQIMSAVLGPVTSAEDRQLLQASYEPCSATMFRLKTGLASEQRHQLRHYWRERTALVRTATPWQVLEHFRARDKWIGLAARQWVIDNVPRDAVIYTERFLGLLPTNLKPVLYADNEDLPTKNIHEDMQIDPAKVPTLRPDYILTASSAKASALAAQYNDYALAAALQTGGEILILKRR